MSEHIELTEPCGVLTVPGVREYVCRLEPVGDAVNVTVCAPTEPVVRCRDCRHSRKDGTLCMFFASWEPIAGGDEYAEIEAHVEPDGFCSWGERRDG